MEAEGWYRDPFGVHTDRWMSDGKPTKLVRDDGVESYDAPPDTEITEPLVPADEPEAVDGSDLVRADEPPPPKPNYRRAVIDVFEQTSRGW